MSKALIRCGLVSAGLIIASITCLEADLLDHLDLPPEVEILLVDADLVDCDILGELLDHNTRLRRRGQHIHSQVAVIGILPQETEMSVGRSAPNWREFIIEHQNLHCRPCENNAVASDVP